MMNTRLIQTMTVLALAVAVLGTAGCSGRLFDIQLFIVGEQTSLEKQVQGTYSALNSNLLMYSSVRGVDENGDLVTPPPVTDSQQAAFEAMRNREYNLDDVQLLLRNGVVGEARDGLLEVRDLSASVAGLDQDAMQAIIDEENGDRQTILERLRQTTSADDMADEQRTEEIGWIFAQINQDRAPEGAFVQDRAGRWIQK